VPLTAPGENDTERKDGWMPDKRGQTPVRYVPEAARRQGLQPR